MAVLRLLAIAWTYELGSWFAFISVITWLERSGGGQWVSAYFVLYNGVQLLAAPILAPILDRYDRGRLLGVIPLLPLSAILLSTLDQTLPVGVIAGAMFALADVFVFNLVPAIIPLLLAEGRISRANAAWSVGSSVIFALAPAGAGVLIGQKGILAGLVTAGILAAISLAVGLGFHSGRQPMPGGERLRWWTLLLRPRLIHIATATLLLSLGGGIVNAALPRLASNGQSYGFILSALGWGSLAAGILLTTRELKRPLGWARLAYLAHALGNAVLAAFTALPAFLGAGFAKGAANTLGSVAIDSHLQKTLEAAVLGRAFAGLWSLANLGQLVGAGAFGLAEGTLGARTLLWLSAGLALLGSAILSRTNRTGAASGPSPVKRQPTLGDDDA